MIAVRTLFYLVAESKKEMAESVANFQVAFGSNAAGALSAPTFFVLLSRSFLSRVCFSGYRILYLRLISVRCGSMHVRMQAKVMKTCTGYQPHDFLVVYFVEVLAGE